MLCKTIGLLAFTTQVTSFLKSKLQLDSSMLVKNNIF